MIEFIAAGLHTTIQDSGRFGFRQYGVPVSGAMDQLSYNFANHLAGNESGTPVLEFMLKGPIIKFHTDTSITLSGAQFNAELEGKKLKNGKVYHVQKNEILKVGNVVSGVYGYLSVTGGFVCENKLNSYSQYKGVTTNPVIKRGDTLNLVVNDLKEDNHAAVKMDNYLSAERKMDVYPGPEFDLLSTEQKSKLFDLEFLLSTHLNRMGYRLSPTPWLSGVKEIITSSVQPGTVQLTPAGQLIILMRDAQTTGGYARILQLSDSAVSRLAQKKPTQTILFDLK